jgi:hypothetical protein
LDGDLHCLHCNLKLEVAAWQSEMHLFGSPLTWAPLLLVDSPPPTAATCAASCCGLGQTVSSVNTKVRAATQESTDVFGGFSSSPTSTTGGALVAELSVLEVLLPPAGALNTVTETSGAGKLVVVPGYRLAAAATAFSPANTQGCSHMMVSRACESRNKQHGILTTCKHIHPKQNDHSHAGRQGIHVASSIQTLRHKQEVRAPLRMHNLRQGIPGCKQRCQREADIK